jgi:hypothetical protein
MLGATAWRIRHSMQLATRVPKSRQHFPSVDAMVVACSGKSGERLIIQIAIAHEVAIEVSSRVSD